MILLAQNQKKKTQNKNLIQIIIFFNSNLHDATSHYRV